MLFDNASIFAVGPLGAQIPDLLDTSSDFLNICEHSSMDLVECAVLFARLGLFDTFIFLRRTRNCVGFSIFVA